MGYIGDRWGSRKALTLSIFLMAFPTFLMQVERVFRLMLPFLLVSYASIPAASHAGVVYLVTQVLDHFL